MNEGGDPRAQILARVLAYYTTDLHRDVPEVTAMNVDDQAQAAPSTIVELSLDGRVTSPPLGILQEVKAKKGNEIIRDRRARHYPLEV